MNRVDCFVDGLLADAFNFCGDFASFVFDFSCNAVVDVAADDLGSIKSVLNAISASAANLHPLEFGLRSSACCKSKPDVGMETLRFS